MNASYALEAWRDDPNETPPQLELCARMISQDSDSSTREMEKSRDESSAIPSATPMPPTKRAAADTINTHVLRVDRPAQLPFIKHMVDTFLDHRSTFIKQDCHLIGGCPNRLVLNNRIHRLYGGDCNEGGEERRPRLP